MLSRYNLRSTFIIDKHLCMRKMSEEEAISYLLQIPKDVVSQMYHEKESDLAKTLSKRRDYEVILDDIVPDEDIVLILKDEVYDKKKFFNYKHFHLSNERIRTIAEMCKIEYKDLVTEPNLELEDERIDTLKVTKEDLESKIVNIDNFLRAIE